MMSVIRKRQRLSMVGICAVASAGVLFMAGVSSAVGIEMRPVVGAPFGSFSWPTGIAVDQSTGNVYVANGQNPVIIKKGNEEIQVFGPEGGTPFGGDPSSVTGSATPSGSFDFISENAGIAVAKGEVFVPDVRHNLVDEFRFNGGLEYEFLCQITGHGTSGVACVKNGASGGTLFHEPLGVAVDSSGDLYIGDYESKAIYEFNPAGEQIKIFDQPDSGSPQYLAVAADGTIYSQEYRGLGEHGRTEPAQIFELKRSSPAGELEGEPEKIAEGTGIAYDQATGHLLVDLGSGAEELDAANEVIRTFGVGVISEGKDIAVNEATGLVYVVNSNQVQRFGPVVILPDLTTTVASEVQPTTATLNGTINPDGQPATSYYFQYGTSTAYGSTSPAPPGTPVSGNSIEQANAPIGGLQPNTTYHYRLVGTNATGYDNYGEDKTLTTASILPVLEGAPSTSNVTRAGVLVHAAINPENSPTAFHVEYVEAAGYEPANENPYAAGEASPVAQVGSEFGGVTVEQLLAGLKPNTTYHYAIVANNLAGRIVGPDGTFTTGSLTPPLALTGGASGVTQNDAVIAGTLNTEGLPTSYGFEVGTEAGVYGPATGLGAVGAGASEAAVSLALTGLVPGTTYHYRLKATNVDGTAYGADQTFTTSVFANAFVAPPAPLPFVGVPNIAFPSEANKPVVKKKAKKTRRHGKPRKKRRRKKK